MPARSLSSLGARHQSRVSTGAQFVTFRLGEEEYGIDISRVREIIRIQGVTHLPGLPSFTEGVINLRGHVIPVIDLRKRFRLSTGTGAPLCGQAEPVHAVTNRFITGGPLFSLHSLEYLSRLLHALKSNIGPLAEPLVEFPRLFFASGTRLFLASDAIGPKLTTTVRYLYCFSCL